MQLRRDEFRTANGESSVVLHLNTAALVWDSLPNNSITSLVVSGRGVFKEKSEVVFLLHHTCQPPLLTSRPCQPGPMLPLHMDGSLESTPKEWAVSAPQSPRAVDG